MESKAKRICGRVEPVLDEAGALVDVRIRREGGEMLLWGRSGPERELRLADALEPGRVPVLIGAGLGVALRKFIDAGIPVAVVDHELDVATASGVVNLLQHPLVFRPSGATAMSIARELDRWAKAQGGALHPIRIPYYLKLSGPYRVLSDMLGGRLAMPVPLFSAARPKVLLFAADYFLTQEIRSAMRHLDWDVAEFSVPLGGRPDPGFFDSMIRSLAEFRPDFVLTVNHFGIDGAGVVAGMLEELGVPLASWFVDNPRVVLGGIDELATASTVLFSYDLGNVDEMRSAGFKHVHWLPLATDTTVFRPGCNFLPRPDFSAEVCFVADSMTRKVAESFSEASPSEFFAAKLDALAESFMLAEARTLDAALAEFEELRAEWETAQHEGRGRALENLVMRRATMLYRLRCVEGFRDCDAVVFGDAGWDRLLASGIKRYDRVRYHDDLPGLYARCAVNFNCTSRQMKGAVNQRVFDVPAAGGFLLTDAAAQGRMLFEPGVELAEFDPKLGAGGVREQIARWLADPAGRARISAAARKRILAEHTYVHRLQTLLQTMRNIFS